MSRHKTVNKLISSCHHNLSFALNAFGALGITEMAVPWQNKEVRVRFFVAAILGSFSRASHVVTLGKCDSIRLGVKVWVKPQSILTHKSSMLTRSTTPQIAEKVSPVDSFSIFRHSLEKNNV